jgi:anti-sigma B factor antagonist
MYPQLLRVGSEFLRSECNQDRIPLYEYYMPFDIAERAVEGILILDLRGRLVAGAELSQFREKLDELARTSPNVILNLEHVNYVDSSGLGALVHAHTSMESSGGALKLLNVSKRSAQLLVLTKLATVLPIFDDERAAVDSFFPDRETRRFDILDFVKSQDEKLEPER